MTNFNIEADFQAELEKTRELLSEKFWEGALELSDMVAAEAPVETSALADSVYANDNNGHSTYAQAVDAATSDKSDVVIMPEEAPMQSFSDFETNVGVAVKHGYMVENGFSPTGPRPPNAFFSRGTMGAEDIFDRKASEAMND